MAELKPILIIKNWKRHAGRTDRSYQWFKVQKTLLGHWAWRSITGDSARFLVDLWSLAAHDGHPGEVHESVSEIAWLMRLPEAEILRMIAEVHAFEFITIPEASPIAEVIAAQRVPHLVTNGLPLGDRLVVLEEKRGEREREREESENRSTTRAGETISPTDSSSPARGSNDTEGAADSGKVKKAKKADRAKKAKAVREAKKAEEFERRFNAIKAAYPDRVGSHRWHDARKCLNARFRDDGASFEEVLAGVHRYVAFLTATDRLGTEYVMMAVTFFGTGKHYEEPWEIVRPKKKGAPILGKLRDQMSK